MINISEHKNLIFSHILLAAGNKGGQHTILPLCFHLSQFGNAPWRLEEAGYEYHSLAS